MPSLAHRLALGGDITRATAVAKGPTSLKSVRAAQPPCSPYFFND